MKERRLWTTGSAASVSGRSADVSSVAVAIAGNCAYDFGLLIAVGNLLVYEPFLGIIALGLAVTGIVFEAFATGTLRDRTMDFPRMAALLVVVGFVIVLVSMLSAVILWVAAFVLIARSRSVS